MSLFEYKVDENCLEVSAPSNIALIKYMGKLDTQNNLPTNDSFSYTLNHLKTYVRLSLKSNSTEDQWSAYTREDLRPIELSEKGKAKFLKFFKFLKEEFNLQDYFLIQSANNFPSDCGLASSASSFAALTLATYSWARHYQFLTRNYTVEDLALISQKGSGSSCRSFFNFWSTWSKTGGASATEIQLNSFHHMVILCDQSVKTVSSSEAHRLVLTSDLFVGRVERVEKRLKQLLFNLKEFNNVKIPDAEKWQECFQICWNEFWDMHTLFHTSQPAFGYLNGLGLESLNKLRDLWNQYKTGPLITMDAGSNIHLLFHPQHKDLYLEYKKMFNQDAPIWCDEGYFDVKSI